MVFTQNFQNQGKCSSLKIFKIKACALHSKFSKSRQVVFTQNFKKVWSSFWWRKTRVSILRVCWGFIHTVCMIFDADSDALTQVASVPILFENWRSKFLQSYLRSQRVWRETMKREMISIKRWSRQSNFHVLSRFGSKVENAGSQWLVKMVPIRLWGLSVSLTKGTKSYLRSQRVWRDAMKQVMISVKSWSRWSNFHGTSRCLAKFRNLGSYNYLHYGWGEVGV